MSTPTYAPCPTCGCPDYYGPATIVYQGAHVVYVECRGCQIRRLPVYAVKPWYDLGGLGSAERRGHYGGRGGGWGSP